VDLLCAKVKLRWVRGGGAFGDGRGRWAGDGMRQLGPRMRSGAAIAGDRSDGPNLGHTGHMCFTYLVSLGVMAGCVATVSTALLICCWCAWHFVLRWRI
jgi:hypothetical protein